MEKSKIYTLKNIEKLTKLLEIVKLLHSQSDIDKLLEIITYESSRILDADRASLFLIDSGKGEIWSKIAQDAEIDEIRLPVGKGIAGWVVSTGECAIVDDVEKDARFNPEIDRLTGYKTRNVLCVPIFSRDNKVIGALEVLNKNVGTFTEEDLQYADILASQIAVALENAQLRDQLMKENIVLKREIKETLDEEFIGESPSVLKLMENVRRVALSDVAVLIRGESGTGKELIARKIHELSPRNGRPFVKVSCAAIPETLLESELFGYEKGAFTGAYTTKKGLFEIANGGTIFLDEIGDVGTLVQAKLLRVLQEKEFLRVGGVKPIKVDVRIISATNRNLEEAIKLGKFREDLFYRLNVITIYLPPLRERKEDIPLLVKHFINKYNKLLNRKFKGIEDEAMEVLLAHNWPGNVRELENVIERAMVLGDEPVIKVKDIIISVNDELREDSVGLKSSIEQIERRSIENALQKAKGNISKAAQMLGIKRATFYYKMKKYKIKFPAT